MCRAPGNTVPYRKCPSKWLNFIWQKHRIAQLGATCHSKLSDNTVSHQSCLITQNSLFQPPPLPIPLKCNFICNIVLFHIYLCPLLRSLYGEIWELSSLTFHNMGKSRLFANSIIRKVYGKLLNIKYLFKLVSSLICFKHYLYQKYFPMNLILIVGCFLYIF